jgi:3-deoxy-D-manno-octulosonic-acid transferase
MPVYAAYWFTRGLGNRSYRDRFGQRFGFGYPLMTGGSIWIHAVSVGEVQAAVPLIKALVNQFPDRRLLVTTVTPTGAARVDALFGDSVQHCYIPFETPFAVTRYFNSVQPAIALIMETEIWPNLYHECGRRDIPLVLVSARISPNSVVTYRRFLPLFRETLSYGIVIAAQSETDAERFRSLGAAPERTKVTGNIKFDIELPEDLVERGDAFRRDNFEGRPCLARPGATAPGTIRRGTQPVAQAGAELCCPDRRRSLHNGHRSLSRRYDGRCPAILCRSQRRFCRRQSRADWWAQFA